MKTELIPFDNYALARMEPARVLQMVREQLAGEPLNPSSLDRVKIPAGGGTTFEVPGLDGSVPMKEVTGVLIHSKMARAFWEGEYQGGNEPPQCSSRDGQVGSGSEGYSPPAKQLSVGRYSCADCGNASWGSAASGRGQACKLMRMLFLVGPETLLPMVLTLPPTSLGPAREFFLRLVNHGIDPTSVVLGVSLEKVAGTGTPDYSRAKFRKAEDLNSQGADRLREYAEALRPYLDPVDIEEAISD